MGVLSKKRGIELTLYGVLGAEPGILILSRPAGRVSVMNGRALRDVLGSCGNALVFMSRSECFIGGMTARLLIFRSNAAGLCRFNCRRCRRGLSHRTRRDGGMCENGTVFNNTVDRGNDDRANDSTGQDAPRANTTNGINRDAGTGDTTRTNNVTISSANGTCCGPNGRHSGVRGGIGGTRRSLTIGRTGLSRLGTRLVGPRCRSDCSGLARVRGRVSTLRRRVLVSVRT